MQSSIYVGLSSQLVLEKRMETLARNVANMNTAGFRAEEVKFSTFLSSFVTLFRWLIGDFDIDELFAVSPGFTVVFFPIFMITFFFVISNMFLAGASAHSKGNNERRKVRQ